MRGTATPGLDGCGNRRGEAGSLIEKSIMIRREAIRRFFLAPLGGLLGPGAAKAKAQDSTIDLEAIERYAAPLRPVESTEYEYSVSWQNSAQTVGGTYGPCQRFDFALWQYRVYRAEGYMAEIRRRPVGEWETVQLPKSTEECRATRSLLMDPEVLEIMAEVKS